MVLDSPPSLAPLTRGLLHFDVLIIINASILPLPLAISCLVWDTLHLLFGFLHIFLLFVLKNHQHSVFLLTWIFISSFSPASSFSFVSITLWGSLHPCLSLESSYSLAHLRSCVAVWVTQVIMVNNCAISVETSLWSGMSSISACLHAAVLNRWRDNFVCMIESQWDICFNRNSVCTNMYCMCLCMHM